MALDSLSLSLLPSKSGTTPSLLDAVYGKRVGGGNPVVALQSALKGEAKGVAAAAGEPQAKREIAAFRAAVASAKSPAELLANPAARKVLLTANGLGDQVEYGALATKALLSDTSKEGSLASKLADRRWLTVAKTFDFANQGLAALKKASVLDSISTGYAEVQWRTGLDKTTPGLSKAIDFRSRAGGITSAVQVLGDPVLRDVVTVALGVPKQIAFQPLEAQERAITSRVDLAQFKSPAFVEQFTRRYLIAAGDAAAKEAATAKPATGVSSLFA